MRKLNFKIEPQTHSLTCWAAVTVSIARYYCCDELKQAEFATRIFGERFNRVCDPTLALDSLNILELAMARPLTSAEVNIQIKKERPIAVCLRHFIGWHLVVIYGITEKNEVMIADPLYGCSKLELNKFISTYRKYYCWTHSYLTKPAEG